MFKSSVKCNGQGPFKCGRHTVHNNLSTAAIHYKCNKKRIDKLKPFNWLGCLTTSHLVNYPYHSHYNTHLSATNNQCCSWKRLKERKQSDVLHKETVTVLIFCLLNRLRHSCILFIMGSYTETIQCVCTFSYYINKSSDCILVQIVFVNVTVTLNSFAMSTVIRYHSK